MAIERLQVFIYDTALPENQIDFPLNHSQRDSVRLTYEGGEDKFSPIMASRFEIALEVEISNASQILYYDHLFTGEEQRLKLIVQDQDGAELWAGWLLPDTYQEPYKSGSFYVNLTATDGLGLLKGVVFNSLFFRAWHSVPSIIAKCLEQTGRLLDIYIDPGIGNAGAGRGWEDVYLFGGGWDGSSPANAYEILEGVLLSLGAILYHRDNAWYIVGVNRYGLSVNLWRRYDSAGVYSGDEDPAENRSYSLAWFEDPVLSLKPPFKTVEIITGVEPEADLFPEDLANQKWILNRDPQAPPPVKYWQATGAGVDLELYNSDNQDVPAYEGEDLEIPGYVGFQHINAITAPAIYGYYMSLKRPVFVRRENGSLRLVFSFNAVLYNPNEVPQVWPEDNLNNSLYYEVLIDGVTVISNREDYGPRRSYFYDFTESIRNGFSYCRGSIDITLADISLEGFIDFRLYNMETAAVEDYVYIENLQITYTDKISDTFTRTRSLKRSNVLSQEIHAGDSVIDGVKNAFIYQPAIPSSELQEVNFTVADLVTGSGQDLDGVILPDDATNFNLLDNNQDRAYLQRAGSDFLEYLEDLDNNGSTLYFIANLYQAPGLDINDRIFVRPAVAGSPQSEAIRINRERWYRTHAPGVDRLGEILARFYHDVYSGPLLAFEGLAKWLLFPGDRLFQTLELDPAATYQFIPVRIEILPEQNKTRITAIQRGIENVTDYV